MISNETARRLRDLMVTLRGRSSVAVLLPILYHALRLPTIHLVPHVVSELRVKPTVVV